MTQVLIALNPNRSRSFVGDEAHALPLLKIETDAGVYGIGECHHDITGLGAKDAVLNAFRRMLIGQDPARQMQLGLKLAF